ncbi:MAG: GHKL domain-containing protein [Eubacteriales bacterium]|nr:GHKL domain-containing protein [Eubacteriales bacterium]
MQEAYPRWVLITILSLLFCSTFLVHTVWSFSVLRAKRASFLSPLAYFLFHLPLLPLLFHPANIPLTILLAAALLFAADTLIFENPFRERFSALTTFLTVYFAAELYCLFAFNELSNPFLDLYGVPLGVRTALHFFNSVIVAFWTGLVIHARRVQRSEASRRSIWAFRILAAILFPVCLVQLGRGLLSLWQLTEYRSALCYMLGILLICAMLCVSSIGNVRALYEEKAANRLLKNQQALEQSYYQLTCDRIREIHRIRHDINGYIQTARALTAQNTPEGTEHARAMLDELQARMEENASFLHCDNVIVNAILEDFCKTTKARVQLDVSLPDGLGISYVDLCSVFHNLLTNAQESCGGPDDVILLRAHKEGGCIYISEQNPVRRKTVKQDGLPHGLGLQILKAEAEKYNGFFRYRIRDGLFCAELLLNEK